MIVYSPVGASTLAVLAQEGFVTCSQPVELKLHLDRYKGGDFRVLYTPKQGDESLHFEAVNEIVRKMGKMVYAVDEVDKNQEPGYAPPQLYQLINYGRHCAVAMIGTARQPAQVSKEYTFGLTEICAFNITEPTQLSYFEKKCGAAAAAMLPSLPQYGYLRWMCDGRVTTGKGWK